MEFEKLKQILSETYNIDLWKGQTADQYVLFDKGRFIAEVKLGDVENSLVFNNKQYTDFNKMLEDIAAYNDTLPFTSDYYCPLFTIGGRTNMAINAYLKKIGLKSIPNMYTSGYCLTDVYDKLILAINYELDDLSNKSSGHIWNMQTGGSYIECSKFKDAEEAIKAINSMLELKCLIDIANEIALLDKISDKRDYNLLKRKNKKTDEITDLKSEIKEKLQKVLNSL